MPLLAPFAHAAGRRLESESILVVVEATDVVGLGEGAPRQHVTGETQESALQAIAQLDIGALDEVLVAPTFADAVRRIETLALGATLAGGEIAFAGAAACAVELALLDAVARRHGVLLVDLPRVLELPADIRGEPRGRYVLNVTLDLDRDAEWVCAMWPAPPRQLKIKMGADLDREVERARRLRAAVGAEAILSIDANMAWSLERASLAMRRLAPLGIAWYEEPMQKCGFAEYAELRRASGERVMLDESICQERDLDAAVDAGACDLVNLKLSKCGGMIPCLRLAAAARAAGLACQIGAMVGELGVLTAARRRFAGMVARLVAIDTPALMRHSIVREDAGVDYETMTWTDDVGPGLGVTLDQRNVERLTHRRTTWSRSNGWVVA